MKMKKFLFALITLISFVLANAQSKEKGTIEITPKIGWSSFSETNSDYLFGSDYNSGVEFGVTADYYFNNRWSFRSGLVFDKMGGKSDFNNQSWEDKFNYLSIPLNANWHFGSTRKWNLNFGFSPSFLLNAKITDEANTVEVPKSAIESFQLGWTIGIGYKIEITKKFGILLDYQYFVGLTDIYKDSGENNRNYGGTFSLGNAFNVGGVIQF
jgi:long-subunit fatty acid transport protein